MKKIEKDELIKKIEEKIGKKIVEVNVEKNNGVIMRGIKILDQSRCSRIIYYQDLEKLEDIGASVDQIVDKAAEILIEEESHGIEATAINMNKDYVLNNVKYKLINREKNKKIEKRCPSKKMLDLIAVYQIEIIGNEDGTGTAIVTKELMDNFGMSIEELDNAAKENTKNDIKIFSMSNMFGNNDQLQEEIPLYVATTKKGINGAAAMMDNDSLRSFGDEHKCDFYILPSSIHEVLFYISSETKTNELREMVASVNEKEVDEIDFLSNNVYFFSRERGEVSIA